MNPDKKILAKVLVGSRLHGLDTPESDYDYRGIHITSLQTFISPFRKLKNTSWIEGDEDNTSYELSAFCKEAVHGNATYLEVLFSDKVEQSSEIHQMMCNNWFKFMDTQKFIKASRGYAHKQWNKFYNFEDVGMLGQQRTAKFAVAFLRVMWQCEQFLLDGKFKCNLKDSDLYPLMKKIKPMTVAEIQGILPEIVAAMTDMNMRVSMAESNSEFKDMKPDLEWIEGFLEWAYSGVADVNRIEVIDSTGRAYVKGAIYGTPVSIDLSYQDDGRTLKIFVEEESK